MSEFLVSDTPSSNSGAQKIPEQTRPVGEYKVNSVSGSPKSNSRLQLGAHQKALKDKFGLDERICANFSMETLEVQILPHFDQNHGHLDFHQKLKRDGAETGAEENTLISLNKCIRKSRRERKKKRQNI
jgi:hypothetical protein